MITEQILNKIISRNKDNYRNRDITQYNFLLGLDIPKLARDRIRNKDEFIWYDMCCGTFDAGLDLYEKLRKDNLHQGLTAVGIDAVTTSQKLSSNVKIIKTDASDFILPTKIDLVTTVCGLYYIRDFLGDANKVLLDWYNQIPKGALMAFDEKEIVARRLFGTNVTYLKPSISGANSKSTRIKKKNNEKIKYNSPKV